MASRDRGQRMFTIEYTDESDSKAWFSSKLGWTKDLAKADQFQLSERATTAAKSLVSQLLAECKLDGQRKHKLAIVDSTTSEPRWRFQVTSDGVRWLH